MEGVIDIETLLAEFVSCKKIALQQCCTNSQYVYIQLHKVFRFLFYPFKSSLFTTLDRTRHFRVVSRF